MTATTLPKVRENGVQVAYQLGKDMLGAPLRYFDELGDTFTANVLGQTYVMTRDPEFISEVLIKQHASFMKDQVTRGVGKLLGNGLLTNDDDSWRPRRKALQGHFQPTALETLIPLVQTETKSLLAEWRPGETIDIHQAMVTLATRTALRALLGVDPARFSGLAEHTQSGMNYFSGVFGTMIPLPLWIPTKTNRTFSRARSALRKSFSKIIEHGPASAPRGTPLDGLFEAKRAGLFHHEELIDEALTMLLAGHDPSALTMTYTLAALAAHPVELAKVENEIRSSPAPHSVKEVSQDSALKRALSESLRLYPASWAVGRECREDVTVLGTQLARGTQITIHQWGAQRHPKWFTEPHKFMPDRWRGDFAAGLPKGLYIPWGAGPRVCIGNHFSLLQMMVSLREILSRFRLVPVSEFPPRFSASLTTQPKAPLLVRIENFAAH